MKTDVTLQKLQVHQALTVGGKEELPGVAALGDVVRNIYDYDTSEASHLLKISENVPSVPRFPQVPPGSPPGSPRFPQVPNGMLPG